jgi:hypothetical protein
MPGTGPGTGFACIISSYRWYDSNGGTSFNAFEDIQTLTASTCQNGTEPTTDTSQLKRYYCNAFSDSCTVVNPLNNPYVEAINANSGQDSGMQDTYWWCQ